MIIIKRAFFVFLICAMFAGLAFVAIKATERRHTAWSGAELVRTESIAIDTRLDRTESFVIDQGVARIQSRHAQILKTMAAIKPLYGINAMSMPALIISILHH